MVVKVKCSVSARTPPGPDSCVSTAINPNHNPNSILTLNGPTRLVRNPKNLLSNNSWTTAIARGTFPAS